jgi:predicted nuclease of predicted toxin-antitoxin system
MKLLLDQNLSRKLVIEIETVYPDSCHLTSILPENSSDRNIWEHALENGFVIVTKDDDFEQRSLESFTKIFVIIGIQKRFEGFERKIIEYE